RKDMVLDCHLRERLREGKSRPDTDLAISDAANAVDLSARLLRVTAWRWRTLAQKRFTKGRPVRHGFLVLFVAGRGPRISLPAALFHPAPARAGVACRRPGSKRHRVSVF